MVPFFIISAFFLPLNEPYKSIRQDHRLYKKYKNIRQDHRSKKKQAMLHAIVTAAFHILQQRDHMCVKRAGDVLLIFGQILAFHLF
jgi:hypothetical protein